MSCKPHASKLIFLHSNMLGMALRSVPMTCLYNTYGILLVLLGMIGIDG